MVFKDMRNGKFVCVFDTLSKQNLCVIQNFLSVNNADTHVIWDSVTHKKRLHDIENVLGNFFHKSISQGSYIMSVTYNNLVN